MADHKYQYMLLADDHVEDLMPKLAELGLDGWYLVATIQEHAFIKLILIKEI